MKLKKFTQLFGKEIVHRGKSYYEQGHVYDMQQITEFNWQAEVMGSELYIVDLTLDAQGGVSYMDCDCPYDDHCKHMVAALYAIEQQPKKATAKKLSLKQLLQQQQKDELIELIISLSKKHKAFKKELEFALTPKQNDVQEAEKIIEHYIDLASGRDGFITLRNAELAVEGIDIVHNHIWEHINNGDYLQAVDLALLCIEKGMDILQFGDDSDGDLSDAVDGSISLLSTIIEETQVDASEAQLIFSKLAQMIQSATLKGWPDWQIELVYAALPLCETAVLEQQLMDLLQLLVTVNNDGWSGEYMKKRVDKIRHHLRVSKLSAADAERYLQQHPEAEELRQQLIQAALDEGNFEKVQLLAEEGIRSSKEQYVVTQWEKYLFIAYRELQQFEAARILAEQLLLKGNESYYYELYELYDEAEWGDKQETLLSALQKKQPYLYEQIIVKEQLADRLLQLCQQHPHLIARYYSQLTNDYEKEVAQIFEQLVTEEASKARNRSHYNAVCQLLATMLKAGYAEKAQQLASELKRQYNKRPAFLDELERVFG